MKIRSIAVFCGSRAGLNPLFELHTAQLGTLLAKHGITTIYGGGNKGLMGAVANASIAAGGKVIGIIPKLLSVQEHQHDGLTELFVVETMHIRKQMLYEKADAAIILPGGYGTLDEVFEMLTWNQLNIHNKQIFILNTAGFYTHLIAHIQMMDSEQMLYNHPDTYMTVLDHPDELAKYF